MIKLILSGVAAAFCLNLATNVVGIVQEQTSHSQEVRPGSFQLGNGQTINQTLNESRYFNYGGN